MNEWTVRVVVDTGGYLPDAAFDAIADQAEAEDATVARRADGGTGLVITVDTRSQDPLDAGSWACAWVVRLVGDDLNPIDVRVATPEIYEAEAFCPDTPELLAATDVAEVLGVSRQRVHQLLGDHPRFPAPYARLGSGPIWSRPAIDHFNAEWIRKPGRPAKAS